MVTKVIELKVIDGEVQLATDDINKLGTAIEKTEKKAGKASSEIKKTGGSLEKGLDGASEAASNLDGGLEGVVQQVRTVGKASKKSGAAMRSALISTGIGAFVVLLGLVIDNWQVIAETIGLINRDLERQIELQKDLIDESEHELTILGLKQKQLEAQGESSEHLLDLRKQETEQLIVQNELLLEKLKLQLQNEQSAAVELSTFQKIVGLVSGQKLIGEVTEEEQEGLRKIREQVQSTETSIERLKLSLIELNNPKTPSGKTKPILQDRTGGVASFDGEEGIADPFQEQKDLDARRLEAVREGSEEFAIAQNERIDLEVQGLIKSAEIQNKKTEEEKANADARIRIAEEEAYAKEEIQMATIDTVQNGIGLLSSVFEKNKGLQKALLIADSVAGIAKIVIGTQAANAADTAYAATLGPAGIAYLATKKTLNTVNAGIGIAANVAATAKALSALGGGSAPSGGVNLGGGGGAQAPAFNVVGTSGVNQLAQSLNQEQAPIQAFVVGSDVTSQQEFERNIENNASIG